MHHSSGHSCKADIHEGYLELKRPMTDMKAVRSTVDGSEIPRPTTVWMVLKPVVNNGINYQPQLVSRISDGSQQYFGTHETGWIQ